MIKCLHACGWFNFVFVSFHVCVFSSFTQCACVQKIKKLDCVSCDAQLSAAGPCVNTLGPQNSKQSIASRQKSLTSTVYDFVGPTIERFMIFTILPSTYRERRIPLRHYEVCVCSQSCLIRQQTLPVSPWVSQARSDPAVSPNYCMSLTCHTFLSLIGGASMYSTI